jgi:hypothetical protein
MKNIIFLVLFLQLVKPHTQVTFQKRYGGIGNEFTFSAEVTSDSGFIITGYIMPQGTSTQDVLLIKTNTIGDTLWTKSYGKVTYDRGCSVQQYPDGGYIVGGTTSGVNGT